MANESEPEIPEFGNEPKQGWGPFWHSFLVLRNRVIAGFVVALPVIITFIIVKWLYDFLAKDVIVYTAEKLQQIWMSNTLPETGSEQVDQLIQAPWFVEYVLAPVTAIVLIIGLLFMLGMIFRSRWHRFFNWFMSNVPGVGVIYKSVSNVVDSIRTSKTDTANFQRVVLVKFPHPGIKVPAFVTSSTIDSNTGKEILCIYVPTTPLPTSGYMLMVPAEEVTEISWDLQETLQAIVSGGITVPESVEYTIGVVDENAVKRSVPQRISNAVRSDEPENGKPSSPEESADGKQAGEGESGSD